MKTVNDLDLDLELTLSDPLFISCQSKANSFLNSIKKSTKFNSDQILAQSNSFFSSLKSSNPNFYSILQVTEKEICQIAFEKKFGSKIIID